VLSRDDGWNSLVEQVYRAKTKEPNQKRKRNHKKKKSGKFENRMFAQELKPKKTTSAKQTCAKSESKTVNKRNEKKNGAMRLQEQKPNASFTAKKTPRAVNDCEKKVFTAPAVTV
jgi:hypothetical protein